MSRRAVSALTVAITTSSPALAHDFWLQPDAFWTTPSSAIAITLQVGDGASRQRSQIPAQRITRFAAFAPDAGVTDLRRRLRTAGSSGVHVELERPGVYILALETDDRARSYLPANAFNDYLRAAGLTPAIELRSITGRMGEGASEKYSRCAKTMIQVGEPARTSSAPEPVGISLEIVAEVDLYATPRRAALPVRVIYAGHALAGASVRLIDLDRNIEAPQTRVTDREGRASFTMPAAGSWLLSVVWTKPLPIGEEADFETTFSSLSFGFPDVASVSQAP